jgi:3',5'-cyclic AMP phosphodiesterase CpdA
LAWRCSSARIEPPVLIAQITDTHIKRGGELVYRRVDTLPMLEAAIAHLNRLDPPPDIVLATGDLTDSGHPEEYARLRGALDRLKQPYVVIPGNHDERENMRAAFADHAYLPRTGEHLHYTVEDLPVRLVALDTLVPGEVGGFMDAARCQWLDDRLGEAPGKPTLVFMHHPPFAVGVDHLDDYKLRGADEFAAVLARHRQVERVACGHAHRAMALKWRGTAVTVCPSTAHQFALDFRPKSPPIFTLEPPGFQLHDWRPGVGLITHTLCVGDFYARSTPG